MLMNIVTALISGILMSVQGIFNTRVSEKAGLWVTTSLVNLTGLILALIILLLTKQGQIEALRSVNKWYLLGGVLGVGITYTVICSMSQLGPACAVMLILIAQVVSAYIIELLGWFETEKTPFAWTKLIGVGLMIGGVVLFKCKWGMK